MPTENVKKSQNPTENLKKSQQPTENLKKSQRPTAKPAKIPKANKNLGNPKILTETTFCPTENL